LGDTVFAGCFDHAPRVEILEQLDVAAVRGVVNGTRDSGMKAKKPGRS
jgi:hypothetical protein